MKTNYKLRKLQTSLIAVCFFLTSFSLYADNIKLNDGKTAIKVTENTYVKLQVENSIADINFFEVKTDKGNFTEFNIEGYSYTQKIGFPKLPVNRRLIEIPMNSTPKVNVIDFKVNEYTLDELGITNIVFPTQPQVIKSEEGETEIVINERAYQENSFTPTTLVSVDVLGIMRGLRIARLNIAPIQYNPVTNTVRIYEEVNVEILFEGADVTSTINMKKITSNIFFNGMKHQIFNYKSLDNKELITDAPAKYVIVSDPMFEAQLQPFIAWKIKKGFEVIEAYTNDPNVGTTTTSIKNYLQGLYEAGTPDDPPPAFVLFVGDVQQIPAFNGTTGGHVTDLYYCEYSGDMLPELYYGRFSANNAGQLQPQIDKTLQYEQYLMPDPSYLNEVVLVSGMDGSFAQDWGNGQINYGTENYFNAAHGITPHVYLYPESGSNAANIRQDVSNGVAFGNYTAHCSSAGWADPSFTITHVPSLQNQDKYGLLVGNCCTSNAYDVTCFGEELLRAENKGALGYIGGSNSTMWDPDYYWGVGVGPISEDPPAYEETTLGAYDGTFHDHGEPIEDWYITQDQMIFIGNLAVQEGSPGSADYYWEIYCLMGDPSLMIYFSEPPELTISYPGAMMLNSETFTVTTEPYAYVGISREGILYGAGIADDTGIAIVTLDPISEPGEVDIVVTKQNRQPHLGTIVVTAPDGPYILMESYQINDAAGNNNGMLDYGETVKLTIAIENVGIETANNVIVTIATTDVYTTINDGSENYGDVAADEVVSVPDGFEISVGYDVPDDHNIFFDFEATDGIEIWTGTFVIKAHAPILEFVTFEISGNGTIDPGETVDLTISVKNIGSSDAFNVIGELLSSDPYITINTSTQSYGNIAPENIAEQVFSITADAGTPTGHLAGFDFDIVADYDITASGDFSIVIGQIPVIIIDLDDTPTSGPVIQDCIDNLNVACEYSTSIPADLSLYSSAFVCLGIYSDNHVLSDGEGQTLADFLNGGGKLYMEGGDTWYYDTQTAVHSMFNINGEADGSGDLETILGQSGSFTEGMLFNYSGQNSWIDHISPTGSAVMIFVNQTPNYGCGVAYDAGDYATVGASFEFGGLDDNSDATKDELMAKYLEFFGLYSPYTPTQVVELNTGYQFISTRIETENPDMLVVLQDILNENLDYVRNSGGAVLRKIGPNWVNGIGEWLSTEGYLFKMLGAESLEFEGVELNPLTVIDLQAGFQFVSFLPEQAIDALYAFEGILSDNLDYIRNSNGEMLRKIGPNWVNGIGDANPGEGYLIKMFANDELVYNIPVKSTLSSLTPEIVSNFTFEGGNAADPVYTMYVSGLNIGDEIAVFDGSKLVGASVISSDNALDNSIPVFNTISNGQGYQSGNEITLKVWDAQSQTIVTATYTFDKEYPTAYTKTQFPAIDGEFSVVNVTKGAIVTEKTTLTEVSIYPNPATDVLNIVSNNTINRVRVLNSVGQIMFNNQLNNRILNLNTTDYQSGIYFIQIETNDGIITEKVTIK